MSSAFPVPHSPNTEISKRQMTPFPEAQILNSPLRANTHHTQSPLSIAFFLHYLSSIPVLNTTQFFNFICFPNLHRQTQTTHHPSSSSSPHIRLFVSPSSAASLIPRPGLSPVTAHSFIHPSANIPTRPLRLPLSSYSDSSINSFLLFTTFLNCFNPSKSPSPPSL